MARDDSRVGGGWRLPISAVSSVSAERGTSTSGFAADVDHVGQIVVETITVAK